MRDFSQDKMHLTVGVCKGCSKEDNGTEAQQIATKLWRDLTISAAKASDDLYYKSLAQTCPMKISKYSKLVNERFALCLASFNLTKSEKRTDT